MQLQTYFTTDKKTNKHFFFFSPTRSKVFSAQDFQERSSSCFKGRRWTASCPLVVPLYSERQQIQTSNADRIVTLFKLFEQCNKHIKISLLPLHCICWTSAMLLGQEKQNWAWLQWACMLRNFQMCLQEWAVWSNCISIGQDISSWQWNSPDSCFSFKSTLSFQLCSCVTITFIPFPSHLLCSLLHLLWNCCSKNFVTPKIQKFLAAAIYLAPCLTNLTVPETLASKRTHSREYHRAKRTIVPFQGTEHFGLGWVIEENTGAATAKKP